MCVRGRVCRRVRGMRKSECVCVGFALTCFNKDFGRIQKGRKRKRKKERERERMGVQKK